MQTPKNNMEKMKFVHCYDDKCSSDDIIDERNANALLTMRVFCQFFTFCPFKSFLDFWAALTNFLPA
uniref:Uncharacterized protein n=1 Tax=Romanomermis culicivorax TaxID=13658 RepID=A0A915KNM4_ROMCU